MTPLNLRRERNVVAWNKLQARRQLKFDLVIRKFLLRFIHKKVQPQTPAFADLFGESKP